MAHAASYFASPTAATLPPRSGYDTLGSRLRETRVSADGSDPRTAMDELLVAIGRERDRGAFARLFGHFAPRVRAYLLRLGADRATADELLQEVMLMVWRRADTFDPAQASAGTWIFAIARNKRIDGIRRERRPQIDPDDPALVPEAETPADRIVEADQDGRRLRVAIATLPPEQAELLRMAFYEDKAHSEIAEASGLPLGTVKSRIRLALGRLRRELKDD
jgi:RNA polymerase sigma factor (sigma-70 family)